MADPEEWTSKEEEVKVKPSHYRWAGLVSVPHWPVSSMPPASVCLEHTGRAMLLSSVPYPLSRRLLSSRVSVFPPVPPSDLIFVLGGLCCGCLSFTPSLYVDYRNFYSVYLNCCYIYLTSNSGFGTIHYVYMHLCNVFAQSLDIFILFYLVKQVLGFIIWPNLRLFE